MNTTALKFMQTVQWKPGAASVCRVSGLPATRRQKSRSTSTCPSSRKVLSGSIPAGAADAGALLGVKTTFTGPVDFNVTAQAQQLDELVVRKPAGIVIFIGDADAMTPGINRAVDEGIPVALVISDAPASKRYCHLGIDGVAAGRIGGEMLAQAIGGKGKVILGTFQSPNVLDRVKGYQIEKYPDIEVAEVVDDHADPHHRRSLPQLTANPWGIGKFWQRTGRRRVRDTPCDDIKIVAMTQKTCSTRSKTVICSSVVQKSWPEMFLAVHLHTAAQRPVEGAAGLACGGCQHSAGPGSDRRDDGHSGKPEPIQACVERYRISKGRRLWRSLLSATAQSASAPCP
jgi:hypothetical protein